MSIGEMFNIKIFSYIEAFSPAIIGLVALSLFIMGVMFIYPDKENKDAARKHAPYIAIGCAIALGCVALARALGSGF